MFVLPWSAAAYFTSAQATQRSSLAELSESLKEHNVELEVVYSPSLHDREIRWAQPLQPMGDKSSNSNCYNVSMPCFF